MIKIEKSDEYTLKATGEGIDATIHLEHPPEGIRYLTLSTIKGKGARSERAKISKAIISFLENNYTKLFYRETWNK